ncbi:hypothetical protein TKK_0008760 [Trichogramma kaykai]
MNGSQKAKSRHLDKHEPKQKKVTYDSISTIKAQHGANQSENKIESQLSSNRGEVIGQRFLGNESHVEHFKLLERSPTYFLIGARNAIYNISLHDLTEIPDQRLKWSSSDAHQELCYLKGGDKDTCQNYVRVFGRLGPDRFLTCGTNAYKPLCKSFLVKINNEPAKHNRFKKVCYDIRFMWNGNKLLDCEFHS